MKQKRMDIKERKEKEKEIILKNDNKAREKIKNGRRERKTQHSQIFPIINLFPVLITK